MDFNMNKFDIPKIEPRVSKKDVEQLVEIFNTKLDKIVEKLCDIDNKMDEIINLQEK